ncbi:MAG: GNAT family N-acetyltransferase [Candidatus Nanopelagicales bacterium]
MLDGAAVEFARRGYGATHIGDVADAAGVSVRTVRRYFDGRTDLFAHVVAERARSIVADRIADQAAHPNEPPAAVLVWAARQIFARPETSWGPLEVEAFTTARRHPQVAELMRSRMAKRWTAMEKVAEQSRVAGAVDATVDDDALVHFTLALSLGMALLEPVVPPRATEENWSALILRIMTALAPDDIDVLSTGPDRRPWRLRVQVPDAPGAMARLLRALAVLHGEALALSVSDAEDGWRWADVVLTAPTTVDHDAVQRVGLSAGRAAFAIEGTPEDSRDPTTRVLDVATELATNPGWAPAAVAGLVGADSWEVTAAVSGADASQHVLRLQWTPERHIVLRRSGAPFTRTDRSRASALLRLVEAMADAVGQGEEMGWVETLPTGATVYIRLAAPEDSDAVAQMHERCSEQTLYQRYFAPVSAWREDNLRRLSGGHRGSTLVVLDEFGMVIGLGNVFPASPDDTTSAEVALLVEDDYQGRGVGSRLLAHLIDMARRLGFREVVALVLTENTGMVRLLERTRLEWTKTRDEELGASVVRLTAPLDPAED